MEQGKAIFIGNIKGGVGKSTVSAFLYDYFKSLPDYSPISLIDTDKQGTAFELLEANAQGRNSVRHVPVSDRFDGLSMVTVDSLLRRMRIQENSLTLIDTGAGWPGSIWQLAMMCECIIVPTSLSWADIRPTIEFVKEIDDRKISSDTLTPHLIIVPNRIPPTQRDLSQLSDNLEGLNVVLAPPLSDLSVVKTMAGNFTGLDSIKGTRFHSEFIRLGQFIQDYVLSGKLSKMYQSDLDAHQI